MPKQDFNINTKSAYAGELYGITITNSQRNTYLANTDGKIQYGYAVKSVGGRRADVGVDSNGLIAGIVLRSLNNEQAKRPGDGTVYFRANDAMSVVEEGYVVVDCANATAGGKVYVATDGSLSADATGTTEATNARFYIDSDEFGMAVIWVENYLGKTVAAA
jgi:hypothetical protein